MAFLKLNRKFFEHQFWNETREYSRAEAWLDLVQMARFEAKQEIIQDKVIEVRKGELPASRRYLEKRWKWGSTKIRNYLRMLEQMGMITQRTTHGQTIITLVKYERYNEQQPTNKPPTNPEATQRQPRGNPNIKNNRSKELKKSKEERGRVFRENAFKECSPLPDLNSEFEKFCEYWVESGDRAKMLRFEKQKTFDVKRRWVTWVNNLEKWKKEKSSAKKQKESSDEIRIGRQTESDIRANADPGKWNF